MRRTISFDTSVEPDHRDVFAACETGDLVRLISYLDNRGMSHPTTERHDVDMTSQPNLPTPSRMLYAAVAHNQAAIVKLLLATYPGENIATDSLLGCWFANPDLSTLKVLHAHDNDIVNMNMCQQDGLDYLLLDYCRSGDSQLAAYLLDNGADPNIGGSILPCWYPLPTAILSYQPLSLIRKLIECGAKVSKREVRCATRAKRTDILEFLLFECNWAKNERRLEEAMEAVLEEAYASNDQDIITLVGRSVEHQRRRNRWRFWTWVTR